MQTCIVGDRYLLALRGIKVDSLIVLRSHKSSDILRWGVVIGAILHTQLVYRRCAGRFAQLPIRHRTQIQRESSKGHSSLEVIDGVLNNKPLAVNRNLINAAAEVVIRRVARANRHVLAAAMTRRYVNRLRTRSARCVISSYAINVYPTIRRRVAENEDRMVPLVVVVGSTA